MKLEQVNNAYKQYLNFGKTERELHKRTTIQISAKGRVQRFAGNHKRERAVESRR